MASVIPQYDQRTRASGPTANLATPTPMDLGPGIQAIAGGAQAIADARERLQRQDDATKVTEKLADLQMKSAQALDAAKASAADDPTDFTPRALGGFDELVSETVKDTTPRVSSMVRQHALQLRQRLYDDSINFETGARRAYRSNAALTSANNAAVALELDPDQWEQTGKAQLALIDEMGFEPQDRIVLKQKVDQTLTQAAAIGVANKTPLIALANLQNAKSGDPRFDGLDPRSREIVTGHAQKAIINQKVGSILDAYKVDTATGTKALANLSDVPEDLADDIRSRVNEQVSQLRNQRRGELVDTIAKVEVDIASDTADRQTVREVGALYQKGALSPVEYGNYLAQIARAQHARSAKVADTKALELSLSQGFPLDPNNSDHRKALDNYFSLQTVNVPVGSEPWQAQASALAAKTRMLPDQATAWTRQAMRSPNPELQANAAQFYGNVASASPDAVSGFDTQTKAFAGMVNSMVESGTNPAAAAKYSREMVFDANQQVIEQRQKAYSSGANAMVKGNPSALKGFIDEQFDPGIFSAQPEVVGKFADKNIVTDFDSQTAKYFQLTGDINQARQSAWNDLTRVYGPSRVNGANVMMAFPPEKFGVTPEVVKADIGAFLATTPQSDGSTADDVVLVPDSLTLRDVQSTLDGGVSRPSYRVVGKSGDLLLDKDGVPLRYELPQTNEVSAAIAASRAAEAKKQLARGKRQRAVEESIQFAQDNPIGAP